MFTRNAICLILTTLAIAAAADPPRDDVVAANNLLKQGKTDAALNAYRSLQIDDPESELLYYNIGCAELESVSGSGGAPDESTAIDSLNNAKKWFDKASMAEDATIRRDARFNRINADSQLAKILATGEDHEGAIKAFENAIFGYEDFLDQYPGHAGATKNLNHMRYLLKTMMQNPPEEQEQQQPENGEGEKNQSGDQQEQQDQQSDQGDQQGDKGDQQEDSEQGQPGDQQEDQAPGDQADDDSMTDEGTPEDEQAQPGDEQSEDGKPGDQDGDNPPKPGEDQSDATGTPTEKPIDLPNKDTIEAILDALQERDKDEQKNMRRVRQNPRRSGPWW